MSGDKKNSKSIIAELFTNIPRSPPDNILAPQEEKLNCWIKYESLYSPFNYGVLLKPGYENPWCILWCQQKKYHKHKEKELIDIWWWMLLLLPGLYSAQHKEREWKKSLKFFVVVTTMGTCYVCAHEVFVLRALQRKTILWAGKVCRIEEEWMID